MNVDLMHRLYYIALYWLFLFHSFCRRELKNLTCRNTKHIDDSKNWSSGVSIWHLLDISASILNRVTISSRVVTKISSHRDWDFFVTRNNMGIFKINCNLCYQENFGFWEMRKVKQMMVKKPLQLQGPVPKLLSNLYYIPENKKARKLLKPYLFR